MTKRNFAPGLAPGPSVPQFAPYCLVHPFRRWAANQSSPEARVKHCLTTNRVHPRDKNRSSGKLASKTRIPTTVIEAPLAGEMPNSRLGPRNPPDGALRIWKMATRLAMLPPETHSSEVCEHSPPRSVLRAAGGPGAGAEPGAGARGARAERGQGAQE